MGQSGAVGKTDRRTDSCRCAGGQTKKKRRPDRPKRVGTFNSAGVCAAAFIGGAKGEKFWELRDGTHNQAGQDKETCSILHLIGEVLYLSTPPTPSQPKPEKRMREENKQKSVFLGVGAADSKKKNNEHISGCQISAYHLPRFPPFP